MENHKNKLFLLIFSLCVYPSVLLASSETPELPNSCEKKLENHSTKRLEKLKLQNEKSVSNLVELKNLAASIKTDKKNIALNKRIVYSSTFVEDKISNHLECFSEVSVFIDDIEKKHLWHTFLVDMKGLTRAIQNPDGDFIALTLWRKAK